MFDTTVENPIPLAEATKLVPPARQGKRTHLSTLLRWILRSRETRQERSSAWRRSVLVVAG